MRTESIGTAGVLNTPPLKTEPKNKEQQISEPKDKISLGEQVFSGAKKAVRVTAGVAAGALLGAAKGINEGMGDAAETALNASGLGTLVEAQDGILKNLAKVAIGLSPLVGTVAAIAGGAGIIGGLAAGFALPGAIAGMGSAVVGAVDGGSKGLEWAMNKADKAENIVTAKYGKIAGKTAQIATAAALGMVALPVTSLLGAVSKGLDFARNAMGFKKNPETTGDKVFNGLVEFGAMYTGLTGAMGAPTVAGAVLSGSAAAGSFATTISGATGLVDGFASGAKQGYRAFNPKA